MVGICMHGGFASEFPRSEPSVQMQMLSHPSTPAPNQRMCVTTEKTLVRLSTHWHGGTMRKNGAPEVKHAVSQVVRSILTPHELGPSLR